LTERTLDVWCMGAFAGTLRDGLDGITFAYAESWVGAGRPPLSQSLPISGEYPDRAAAAFFGGLLPEGEPRTTLARRIGVSVDNDFSLLAALGGDTAGAVSLVAPGERPPTDRSHDVRWLNDAELAEEIRQLPSRPMHADEDGEYRLSLAGAQDKLPVVVHTDGRVGLTHGAAPSTHIMKTPIVAFAHTVANEALCLDLGRRLGVPTAPAMPRRVGGTECLLVERYDRERHAGGVVERLHQEDVCQALGIPTARKYENEGGPSLADCFALVRRASGVPGRDAVRLFNYVLLSFLVGNHDAHGKNYSLVYRPGDAGLAPAYDILSTAVYGGTTRKMAMKLGGEYRPDYVRARHLDALIADAGLGPAAARRRVVSLAEAAPTHARDALAALEADGWGAPVLDRIVELVERRAAMLEEAATSSSGRGAPSPVVDDPTLVTRLDTAWKASGTAYSRLGDALHAYSAARKGGPDDVELAASRIDEVADDCAAANDQLSQIVWEWIDAVDERHWDSNPGHKFGSTLRTFAAQALDGAKAMSQPFTTGDAMDDARERLAASLRTIGEWDARLDALGVPAPEPVDPSST
jgi:serine/threonine-protein kinase HipA